MKKIVVSSLVFLSLLSCSSNDKKSDVVNTPTSKQIDNSQSSELGVSLTESRIAWVGSKAIGGKHNGDLLLKSGRLIADNKQIEGDFEIDMNSITCRDIKDPESNKDLVNHLSSSDFFDVANFPVSKAKLSATSTDNGSTFKGSVNLMIKGIVKKQEVLIDSRVIDGKKHFSGVIQINRTDFEIVYNSKNFFKNLGDKIIDDMVIIKFILVTNN